MTKSLVSLSKEFNIPVVKNFTIDPSLENISSVISSLKNKEGLVVRYDFENSSYFLKIKTEEYIKIHKIISNIIIDKNLVETIFLEKMDDILSVTKNEKLKKAIIEYENDFTKKIENFAFNVLEYLNKAISSIPEDIDKKEKKKIFATQYVNNRKEWSSFLFLMWDKEEKNLYNLYEIVKNYYLKNITNSKKFEEFKNLLGLNSFSEYYKIDIDN